MQRNILAGDWDQLRIHAHSLKPQADFMGINSLKEELIKIEEAVRTNNFEMLENLFDSSFKIATDCEIILKKMLAQL